MKDGAEDIERRDTCASQSDRYTPVSLQKGVFVVTDKAKQFPQVNGVQYEPDSYDWISPMPYLAEDIELYHKNVKQKCNPISRMFSLKPEEIERALHEVKEKKAQAALPKRKPGRPPKVP